MKITKVNFTILKFTILKRVIIPAIFMAISGSTILIEKSAPAVRFAAMRDYTSGSVFSDSMPTACSVLAQAHITESEIKKYRIMADRISYIESRQTSGAVNHSSGAAGILQLKKIYVDEVNRIIDEDSTAIPHYTYSDRFSDAKSFEMFCIIQHRHNRTKSLKEACAIHNTGTRHKLNKGYYRAVKAVDLYEIENKF